MMPNEKHVFIDTPWTVADAGHVVFDIPKNDSEFGGTVSILISDQLALPYTGPQEVTSLDVIVQLTYNDENIHSRRVSVPAAEGELAWLRPDNLLKSGPRRLLTDVVVQELCVAAGAGLSDCFDDDDDVFKFLTFIGLVASQDELAEKLFEQGEMDTCYSRDGGTDGTYPVDQNAPGCFRWMTSGGKIEAQFVGYIGDTIGHARFVARECGIECTLLDNYLRTVPATSLSHSGFRFLNERSDKPRMFDLWRMMTLLGIDDDRTFFYDDSEVCIECRGIIDAHYGHPGVENAVFVEAEGYLCQHCAQADVDALVKWAEEQTPDEIRDAFPAWLERCVYEAGQIPSQSVACVGAWAVPGLEAAGYGLVGDDFRTGLRSTNDSPEEIAKQYDEKMGDQQYVFVINGGGDPFETRFSVYSRPVCDIADGTLSEDAIEAAYDALIDNINASRNE